jgi:hypothetical protein
VRTKDASVITFVPFVVQTDKNLSS